MVVLLEGSPISTEELWSSVSEHLVFGHLSDQDPSPPIAQFVWAASSRKSLGGSKLLPFTIDGGHCVLGDLQCCRNLLVPFPRIVPRHNPVSELYGQFLPPHDMIFALTCTVNCGTLYRQVCAFPNTVQSIEFNTGGHLKDDPWKRDASELNFESHSEGSEYLAIYVFYFELLL